MAGFQGSSAINAHEAAIALYDKVIEIDPYPIFYTLRSFSCQMRNQEGDLLRVIRDSNKALKLDENWGAAHFSKAISKISLCIDKVSEELNSKKQDDKDNQPHKKSLKLKHLYTPTPYPTTVPLQGWQCCFNTSMIFLKLEDRPYIYGNEKKKMLRQIDLLKIARSHNIPAKTVHIAIARAYKHIENYEKALKFYKSAYEENLKGNNPTATNTSSTAIDYCTFWAKCIDFANKKEKQLDDRSAEADSPEESKIGLNSFKDVKAELLKSIENDSKCEYGTLTEIIDILEQPRLCQSDQKEYLYSLRLYLLSISQSKCAGFNINKDLRKKLDDKLAEYPDNAFSNISLMTLKDLFDSSPEDEDSNAADS